jgi:hypothetical protein
VIVIPLGEFLPSLERTFPLFVGNVVASLWSESGWLCECLVYKSADNFSRSFTTASSIGSLSQGLILGFRSLRVHPNNAIFPFVEFLSISSHAST